MRSCSFVDTRAYPIRNSFITETVLVGRCIPQEYARKWPQPGHPSEAANPDNWPLLKDRISRPLMVPLQTSQILKLALLAALNLLTMLWCGLRHWGYDASGRVSTVTRAGVSTPTTTAMMYDGAGQMTSLTHSAASTVLDGYDITRDTRGNPTKVATSAAGATTTALCGYDTVSRLTSECYPATGVSCTSTSPNKSYTYDTVGNRKTLSARTVSGTTASTVSTAYAYDAADQLLSQTVAGAPTVTNTWTLTGHWRPRQPRPARQHSRRT